MFVSGAPEEIFALAQGAHTSCEEALGSETAKGRRAIAVAEKEVPADARYQPFSELEQGLSVVGLLFLEDPPRKDVKETIERARNAGIHTIMVTGDHPETARFIAQSVGINADKVVTGAELDQMADGDVDSAVRTVGVFARTTPEHKYRLVNALHHNGEIVAVTGDGINDILALKGADIGIAMGIKGTDADQRSGGCGAVKR